MKRLLAATALLCSLSLAAQSPAPKPPVRPAPAPIPTISADQRAKFFKAQSYMIQANDSAKKAQEVYQSTVAELTKACGDKASLQSDQSGDPVCIANPAVEKK